MKNATLLASSYRYFIKSFLLVLISVLSITIAKAQVSVTATAGIPGPTSYTTLKGAFDALNLGTHQGSITITITAGTTENATAVLNASGTGSASFTKVVIKPGTGATPTVTGSIAAGPVIKLNGANNVMIDGSNNGTSSQDLTISNTTTTTPQALVIGSVGTTPVINDTLKNCHVVNGANTSSCIIVSDAATPGTAGYFNNISIVNNTVQKAYIGTYLIATVTGTNGSGCYVAHNNLSASGANAIRLCAIYVQGLSGAVVDSNTVGNFESASAEFDRAIWCATGTTNTTISNNTVLGLSYTGATVGYAPIGIYIGSSVAGANVVVTDNTVTNLTSSSSGLTTGIYFAGTTGGVTIQRNKVSNIKNTYSSGAGCAGIYLAGSNTSASANVINNFVWDVAAVGLNGWTSASNGNGIVIDAGGGYNIYYNSVWLNTNQTLTGGNRAACMLITTGVTTTNAVNLRNNIFSNTQTVGNANSRFALVITAPISTIATFNYNDYYASSTNLASQGSNLTIWNTIAQIQANMTLNGASVSIQPNFTSATDLHLPLATNTALNNLGVNIPAITDDIDLDPRTTTPDMGADEFGNCQTVTITTQPTTTGFCEGGNTSMTVAGTNGNVFQWQVNTGSGFANITNGGVYSGATTGTLTITGATANMNGYTYKALVSYAAFCTAASSNIVTLVVNPLPNVNVTSAGSTIFCTGGTDVLSVPTAANLTYQWMNGASNITGATNASYTANATGNYSVTVANSVTGCLATSSPTTITVGSGPAAVISPSGTQAICQGTGISLSAGNTGGVTYQWNLNGNPITGATSNTYSATAGGAYTVIVSTSSTCNTTSTATTVNVNPLPAATATPSGASAICQGNTITLNANTGSGLSYQWLLNNAIVTGATSNSYTVGAAGSYRVKVTNTSTTCKDTSAAAVITVNPLPTSVITPAIPPAICQGDTSLLTVNSGTGLGYQWKLNGNNISGATASTYKAFATGSYSVMVTNANGCQKLSTAVVVTVNPLPPAQITYNSPLSFCDGGAVVLNGYPGAGLSYQWLKDGNVMPGITTMHNIISESGDYSIRVTNNFNCVSVSPTVSVTVNPIPVPLITFNGSTLSTGTFATYQWHLNNVPIGGATNITHQPAENGAYKVVVTDANGCTGTSEIFFLNNLSVGGVPLSDRDIVISPNPATAFIVVDNKTKLKLEQLSIINSVGAVVYTRAATTNKEILPTATLASGMYYIRIQTSNGVQLRKIEIVH